MFGRTTPHFISDHGEGSRILVTAERPFAVQVDGDDRGSFTEVEIVVMPAAARVLSPGL